MILFQRLDIISYNYIGVLKTYIMYNILSFQLEKRVEIILSLKCTRVIEEKKEVLETAQFNFHLGRENIKCSFAEMSKNTFKRFIKQQIQYF